MQWLYDDTFEGFLSTVFEVYRNKDEAAIFSGSADAQLGLQEERRVITNAGHVKRVQRKLETIDSDLPRRLYYAWLSRETDIEQAIMAYIRLCIEQDMDVCDQRYRDTVRTVLNAARKVGTDVYHYQKFVRFVRAGREVYVADIEPDYDVLELLSGLFEDRLDGFNFIIRDIKRRKCLVWDQRQHWISYDPQLLQPVPNQGDYEVLWQTYFKHIAIPERINPKLQTLHVPKRYRKHMTEFSQE
ncbi:MAG: TIGR03915 family putative DNA repair protein [Symbiobacteriaceae bacterium]|nr:TIGR03915 family putative DNA repair protein [Symbiobacteriaceae bacterium]